MEGSCSRIHGHSASLLPRAGAADRERPHESEGGHHGAARPDSGQTSFCYAPSPKYSHSPRNAWATGTYWGILSASVPPGQRWTSRGTGAWQLSLPWPAASESPPPEDIPSPFADERKPPQYPHASTPQPGVAVPAPFQPPFSGPYGSMGAPAPAGISVETLSNDIQSLIVAMKTEFSHNPHDASVQNRLRALLDLQGVLQRQSLPPDQLELIKNKVTELAAVTMRPSSAQNSTQNPALVPPPGHATVAHSASVTPAPALAHPGQASVTLDSLLGAGALAALMARQSATPQNSTPNPPYTNNAIRSPPPAQAEQPGPPAQNPMALLDRLRQAGMLPGAAPTNAGAAPPPPPSILPPNIASILSSAKAQAAQPVDHAAMAGLSAAALKQQ